MKRDIKFTIKKTANRVYAILFDNRYDLAMSFVRLQEYYESPDYKGKYFTLEEYIDYWSINHGNDSFTYPSVWSGFNIPGNIFAEWVELFLTKNNDIRDKELQLVKRIKSRLKRDKVKEDECYFIGACKSDPNLNKVISHEVAHALYNIDKSYRKSCGKIFEKILQKEEYALKIDNARKRLLEMGYCEEVVFDEIQAYWSTSETKDESNPLSREHLFVKNYSHFINKGENRNGKKRNT